MPITDSRVKNGTLTFGTPGVSFACQATNVRQTPSYEADGDAVETLCGDKLPEGKKESYTLAGTVIQDYDNATGFLSYCFDNAMETVAYEWVPNDTGAPTFAGNCVILALEEGGDVGPRNTTDFEFDVVGRPTRTYGVGTQAAEMAEAAA